MNLPLKSNYRCIRSYLMDSCRRGGRALEEPLDLEQLGGAEKVLQLVLRYGNLSGVDEPAARSAAVG